MTHGARLPGPARLVLLAGLLLPLTGWARWHPPTNGEDTATPTPTLTETPPASTTQPPAPSEAPTSTETPQVSTTEPPILSETPTSSDTPTSTVEPATGTTTATPTPSPTLTESPSTPLPPRTILISEVAWSGTLASSADEWIELYNTSSFDIDLAGWSLTDGDDIRLSLRGIVPAHGFYLLERTDDTTVADIAADQIYTGSLRDSGETLWLQDPTRNSIDSANAAGGPWPAGGGVSKASMERLGGEDLPGNWRTFTGFGGVGRDAAGNPIAGTPRHPNSTAPASSPTPLPTSCPPLAVMINEVAWAGTRASSSDEWIELYNPGAETIDLARWSLSDGDDLHITLNGSIPAHGFYLLERTDDATISDLQANQIYSGGLNNSGETLWLRDPTGALIDSANLNGGGWPAGASGSKASMERRGGQDVDGNWGTYTGYYGVGHDAAGNTIAGTPAAANSLFFPTPVPTWIPGQVVINEVLIRPHYDWQGTGGVNAGDEFVELYNLGPSPVYLRGWFLDDVAGAGSQPFALPGVTIDPGSFVVFFHTQTHITLNDSGDTVRLLAPDGRVIDEVRYLRIRAYNLSYGRLPDGSHHFAYGLWPTPMRPNLLFVEPMPSEEPDSSPACPAGGLPEPRLPRLVRHPALARWFSALGHVVCR